jgi:hypothetical protein
MSGEIVKARSYTGGYYVGLGDQFDDDRRLVREATSELPPGNTSHLGWRKSSINS